MAQIELDGITKIFETPDKGSLTALEDLTFQANRGELICVLGFSGCGKSTILNMIAGTENPTRGQVLLDGKPLTAEERQRLIVGYVFQQPRLLPWKTVMDNVKFSLEATNIVEKEHWPELLDKYVEMVGLNGFEKYLPGQLSGGMQSRVSIARSLVLEPQVMLMDEPFSNLDEITARKMRGELLAIWQKTGMTIIFVTHDLSEAVYLAQRVILLTPRPARVYQEYAVDVPQPRYYTDERIFEVEKRVLNDLNKLV